jgi:hypothetical protein
MVCVVQTTGAQPFAVVAERRPAAASRRVRCQGGDCLSDLAVLGDQPELFGPVASTPTAWRVVERIADPDGLARLRAARAHARAPAWAAGARPDVEMLIMDADAILVLATATPSRRPGHLYAHLRFCLLLAYLDRGEAPGEPLAGLLRRATPPSVRPAT